MGGEWISLTSRGGGGGASLSKARDAGKREAGGEDTWGWCWTPRPAYEGTTNPRVPNWVRAGSSTLPASSSTLPVG